MSNACGGFIPEGNDVFLSADKFNRPSESKDQMAEAQMQIRQNYAEHWLRPNRNRERQMKRAKFHEFIKNRIYVHWKSSLIASETITLYRMNSFESAARWRRRRKKTIDNKFRVDLHIKTVNCTAPVKMKPDKISLYIFVNCMILYTSDFFRSCTFHCISSRTLSVCVCFFSNMAIEYASMLTFSLKF